MKVSTLLVTACLAAGLIACAPAVEEVQPPPDAASPVIEPDTAAQSIEEEVPEVEAAAKTPAPPTNFYSDDWYVGWGWSGEYPAGFSVIREDLSLQARSQPDPDIAHDMTCALPYLAGFHPWNNERNLAQNAAYMTATKGFYLTVKEAGTLPIYEPDSETEIALVVGDKIKFERYLSEGWFVATYKNYPMRLTLGDLPPVTPEEEWPDLVEDEWLVLDCAEGRGWLKLTEVQKERGIGINSMKGFGTATDITEEEAATGRGYEDETP